MKFFKFGPDVLDCWPEIAIRFLVRSRFHVAPLAGGFNLTRNRCSCCGASISGGRDGEVNFQPG